MQRPSRQQSESRQERAALLESLAALRTKKTASVASGALQAEQPAFPTSMASDVGSDFEEDQDSSWMESHSNGQGSNEKPSKPAFRRLRKKVPENAIDSIADSLAALDVDAESPVTQPEAKTLPAAIQLLDTPDSAQQPPSRQSPQDAEGLCLGDNSEFKLDCAVSQKLYAHQVEGVKWLWSLHRLGRGGIMGDDMGLGKTMQCAAFMSGMIKSQQARRALVVAPKTLLAHWEKELGVCGLASLTHEYYGTSQCAREDSLRVVLRKGGVLLTTYGMILHNAAALSESLQGSRDSEEPLWDILILDEGHKIKNPRTQLAQRLRDIPVKLPVIISGTPIQNDLIEMHALMDFVCPGLLGDVRFFKQEFVRAITAGTDKGATQRAQSLGAAKAAELRARIGPYFLRREKQHVLKSSSDSAPAGAEEANGQLAKETCAKPQAMGRKNDLVVWLKLQPMQRRIYEAFLNSSAIKAALNKTGSALAALTVLKKVCDHPALLSDNAANLVATGGRKLAAGKREVVRKGSGGAKGPSKGSLGGFIVDDDVEDSSEEESSDSESDSSEGSSSESEEEDIAAGLAADASWGNFAEDGCVEQKLLDELTTKGTSASCKTRFVLALVDELVGGGHRVLVFSQSRLMLDILAGGLSHAYLRIDGSVTSAAERQARVARFQSGGQAPPVFLLTSQVGGLGLTLTAADRVIIVDPSWNPSMDNQAVDRAFRIGQSRDVVVYRLITCGTVEEKIYRKQVYKGGLFRTGTEEGIQTAYFSSQDLRDLFRLEPAELEVSVTQRQLDAQHGHQRNYSPELTQHLKFLQGIRSFAGVSDHDLLFSEKGAEPKNSKLGSGAQFPELPPPGQRSAGTPSATRRKPPAKATSKPGPAWQGAGDISDLFKRSLSLGLPDQASTTSTREARIAEVKSGIQRYEAMLKTMNLPDGGARILARISEQRRQLDDIIAEGEEGSSQSTDSNPPQSRIGDESAFSRGTAAAASLGQPFSIARSFLGTGSYPTSAPMSNCSVPTGPFSTTAGSTRPPAHKSGAVHHTLDLSGESPGRNSVWRDHPAKLKATGLGSAAATLPQPPAAAEPNYAEEASAEASGQLPRGSCDEGASQIRRAASAEPAESAGSFHSSRSEPDQDPQLIDLTSPAMSSLPEQKHSNTGSHSRGPIKSESQEQQQRQTVPMQSKAGMEPAGSSAGLEAGQQEKYRPPLSVTGKENETESSNIRRPRLPSPRSEGPAKGAVSCGVPETIRQGLREQEAGRLKEENSRLKQKLRRYVDALSNPAALAQMTDGGAHVKAKAKAVSKERERIKGRLAELHALAQVQQ